jgi:hypothetical protein
MGLLSLYSFVMGYVLILYLLFLASLCVLLSAVLCTLKSDVLGSVFIYNNLHDKKYQTYGLHEYIEKYLPRLLSVCYDVWYYILGELDAGE